MSPLVSVIIPTYNNAHYLLDAVKSVLQQTFQDFELIIIDDGSTDQTPQVMEPYLDKVKYIRKKNGGPAQARNRGIQESKGKLLAFLDADDIWEPEKLSVQVPLLEREQADLVYAKTIKVNEKNQVISRQSPSCSYSRPSGKVFSQLIWNNFIPLSTVIVKRECVEEMGGFDERKEFFAVEDYDLWLRLSTRYRFEFVDQPLCRYRVHGFNISAKVARSYLGEKRVLEKNFSLFPKSLSLSPIQRKKRFAELYFEMGIAFLYGTKIQQARSSFAKSVLYYPLHLKAGFYWINMCLGKQWVSFVRKLKRGW